MTDNAKSITLKTDGWYWFITPDASKLTPEQCGKWMYFFEDQHVAEQICQQAIDENVCWLCKCTDLDVQRRSSGVLCFYQNADDINAHKRIIFFMINNGLIKHTKTGKLYNLSFKYDTQTLGGEYGPCFTSKLKLEKFIDLKTGAWIYRG